MIIIIIKNRLVLNHSMAHVIAPVVVKPFSLRVKGRRISGEFRIPTKLPKGQARFPVVVFSHGFYGHGLNSKRFLSIAGSLARKGIASVLFDYSGCGESTYPYVKTSIKTEAEELDAILLWVRKRRIVNPHKIGVVGHSMGGPVALTRGPQGINALAMLASPADQYNSLKKKALACAGFHPYGISWVVSKSRQGEKSYMGQRFWRDVKKYNYKKFMTGFHCPVLFVHGTKDKQVPVSDSKRYLLVANAPKQMLIINGADHNFKKPIHLRHLVRALTHHFTKYFLQRHTEVVDIFVRNKDTGKFLMLKRAGTLGFYRDVWGTTAGHVDEGNAPLEQSYIELLEETGLKRKDVSFVAQHRPLYKHDAMVGKIWKVNALLFETGKTSVKLNWENVSFAWVTYDEFRRRCGVPGMADTLALILKKTPSRKSPSLFSPSLSPSRARSSLSSPSFHFSSTRHSSSRSSSSSSFP